ncbi:hypothetical protein L226DRAFT_168390 [Lentinus tigrinus ALCF2SS1-7]|uniref:RING-type domain-containing protein n=1 Tax=Lentinus tigrinus ALCF2SS1-6 TaxID=1328759 RepID=A0A5C2S0K4_9APHY|nr:hypothetical protein L227DRAFT_578373 [Lentinus tigrinus ALCF2SS1-6]RPD71773.1 hypothetical protein L226DRAFT_168390 [Lentinus tigrinus ALCF2SS1-7]
MAKKKKPEVVCHQCKKSFKGEDACISHADAKGHRWQAPTTSSSAKKAVATNVTVAKKKTPAVLCYQCKKSFDGQDACIAHAHAKGHRWQAPTTSSTTAGKAVATKVTVQPAIAKPKPPTPILTTEERPMCSICSCSYEDESVLKEHLTSRNTCMTCKVHYPLVWDPEDHYATRAHWHPQCGHCGLRFRDHAALGLHHCPFGLQGTKPGQSSKPSETLLSAKIGVLPSTSPTTNGTVPKASSSDNVGTKDTSTTETRAQTVSRPQSAQTRTPTASIDVNTPPRISSPSGPHIATVLGDYSRSPEGSNQGESSHAGHDELLQLTTGDLEALKPSAQVALPTDADIPRYDADVASRVSRVLPTEPAPTTQTTTHDRGQDTRETRRNVEAWQECILLDSPTSPSLCSIRLEENRTQVLSAMSQTPTRPSSPVGHILQQGDNEGLGTSEETGSNAGMLQTQSWHCRACLRNPCKDPVATLCGHLFCRSCLMHIFEDDMRCSVCGQFFLLQLDLQV